MAEIIFVASNASATSGAVVQVFQASGTVNDGTDIVQVDVDALGNVNTTLPALGTRPSRLWHKIAGGAGTITLVRTAAQIAAGTMINGVAASYILVGSNRPVVSADDIASLGWLVYDDGTDFWTA